MSLPIQGMNPNLSTPTNTGGVNSFQSLTLSPILLVLGYCVVIPISIFYKN